MVITVSMRPVEGSQLPVVNYLFGPIFLPLPDYKLLRNRNCLTHFRVSHRPQSSHCGLSGSISGINAGPLTAPTHRYAMYLLPSPHTQSKERKCQEANLAHKDR